MGNGHRLTRSLGAILAASVVSVIAGAAWGDENLTEASVADTDIRALAGLGIGAEAEQLAWKQRLRVGLGAYHGPVDWAQARVSYRLVGTARNGLWLRGGLLGQQGSHYSCNDDRALAVDGGFEYRAQAINGAAIATGLGVEDLSRNQEIMCADSSLKAHSNGIVADISARLPLGSSGFAVYSRVSVRTAQHVVEILWLPELWAGLSYAFSL